MVVIMTEVVCNRVIVTVVVIMVMADVDGNRLSSLWLNATVIPYVILRDISLEGDMML